MIKSFKILSGCAILVGLFFIKPAFADSSINYGDLNQYACSQAGGVWTSQFSFAGKDAGRCSAPAGANNNSNNNNPNTSEANNSNNVNPPTKSGATDDGGYEGGVAACLGMQKAAESTCTVLQVTPALTAAVQSVTSAVDAGDMKKACEASRALNGLAGASNTTFGFLCKSKSKSCEDSCNLRADNLEKSARAKACARDDAQCVSDRQAMRYDADKAREAANTCSGLKNNAYMGFAQAAQNAVGLDASQACLKQVAAAKCETVADIKAKPQCYFQLCGPGGRYQGTTECKPVELDCADATNFGTPYCVCKSNPQDPVCPGAIGGNTGGTGGLDGGGTTGGSTSGTQYGANTIDGGFTDADLMGAIPLDPAAGDPFAGKNEQAPGGSASQGQPGSPFSGGGGNFAGNPGGGGARGPGKGPYNTDILQGPSGSGGGYSSGGTGSYPYGSAAANGDAKNGMNLKDFLPGGRGIAGKKVLEKNGITESNGLSNFEKVTRQVNTLRNRQQVIESK